MASVVAQSNGFSPDDNESPYSLSYDDLCKYLPIETHYICDKLMKGITANQKQNHNSSLMNIMLPQVLLEEEVNNNANIDYMYKKYFTRRGLKAVNYPITQFNDELKLKFALVDLDHWITVPRLETIMLSAGTKSITGFVYCYLQVGPWRIQWVNDSLTFIEAKEGGEEEDFVGLDFNDSISLSDSSTLVKVN